MDPWLVTTSASGIVLAAFGILLVAADPRRDWNRVFALFAVFWGLQIVLANAVRTTDNLALAHVFGTMTLALLIPLYFFLVVFASIFPRPRSPFATSWTALLLLLAPAATALTLLLAAPHLLLTDVVPVEDGGTTLQWGPLFPPFVVAPLYGGFLYALFIMMRRLVETEQPIERRQVLLVLIALGLFVAYNVPLQLILFGLPLLGAEEQAEATQLTGAFIAAIMLVGLTLLFLVARNLVRAWHHSTSQTAARETRTALVALAVAAGIGTTEGLVDIFAGVRLQSAGMVRTAATGLIVYGVARYQLFDLDLRVKNAVPLVTTTVLAGAGGVVTWSLLTAIGVGTIPRIGLIAGLVILLGVAFGVTIHRLTDRIAPHVADESDHLELRKLEVYRAALEAGTPQGDLENLARRLGLHEQDRTLAEQIVRQRTQGTHDLSPGALAFDRYLVEARIGQGSYGRVFLARDTRRGRHVVIKELEARWRGQDTVFARFLREAKIMGRLKHPNITTLHEVERRGDDHYLVMEHIEGGTLAERLQSGRIPYAEILPIISDLASALGAAHQRGIVHRDLKPANVLLDLEGRPHLADFGVAGLYGETREETLTGLPSPEGEGTVGNLQYMAPEQARGAPAAPSADVYALGAILYHMLTGKPHREFSGLDPEAAREQVARGRTPPLGPVPELFQEMIRRLMSDDPRARPATGTDAAELLGTIQPGGVPVSEAVTGAERAAAPRRG